jgi:hypothetical protein
MPDGLIGLNRPHEGIQDIQGIQDYRGERKYSGDG